jgi:hypothetical protein
MYSGGAALRVGTRSAAHAHARLPGHLVLTADIERFI